MAAGVLPTLASSGALGSTPGSSAQRRPRRQGQPRPQQQQQQAAQGQPQQPQAPAPTFAQMQQNGQARPAPPSPTPQQQTAPSQPGAIPQYTGSQQAGQVRGQLQQSVQQALANPSRYDAPTFTSIRDAAYGDLKDQFAKIRDTTDTNLARRGLAASTFGANDLHDVDSAQSRAMADLNATLLKDAAATQAGDRSAAYGMGSDLAGLAGSQDLAAYGANANTSNQNFQNDLAKRLGEGNLALSEGSLTGTYNGAPTQAASQFNKTFDQSNTQFDKSFGLQQQQADLARQLGLGGLDLQKQSLAQSGTQFDKTFGLQQQQAGEQSRQFDLQQALSRELGLGGLDLQKQSLAQAGSQFDRSLDQSNSQFGQTYNLNKTAQETQAQQFKDQLAQLLGIAQMGNDTQNRALQQNATEAQNTFIAQLLQALGPGADLSKVAPFLPAGTLPAATTTPAATQPVASVPKVPAPTKPSTGNPAVDAFLQKYGFA